jgi:plastocyanin
MNVRAALLVAAATFTMACGGGSESNGGGGGTPLNPSNPSNPPVATTTVTITANGVSPQRIQVPLGTRVTFINNDSRPHEMNSDPHPTHGDCPAIDDVGFIAAGQTKLTGNLTVARTCGFHDHQQPTVASLTGQIIVQ